MEPFVHGKMLMHHFCNRLIDLQHAHRDGLPYYSESLRSQIDELMELRREGWPVPVLVLQVEEVRLSDADATRMIRASNISGKECAWIEGDFATKSEKTIQKEVAESMG